MQCLGHVLGKSGEGHVHQQTSHAVGQKKRERLGIENIPSKVYSPNLVEWKVIHLT